MQMLQILHQLKSDSNYIYIFEKIIISINFNYKKMM